MNLRSRQLAFACIAAVAATIGAEALAQDRVVKIAGFNGKTGVGRSFGLNAEAAMLAAADAINRSGGVKLGDGARGRIEVTFYDDRGNAEEGIAIIRRVASGDAIVAIGPGASNVAEPLYGILQKKVDDPSDSGLQMPVFTDGAIKVGLAKISEWAFRNVPNEQEMYKSLFAWVRAQHPDLQTVYGGVEEDFAHSRSTWYAVMKERAKEAGFEVKGETKWLLADTNFATQVRQMKTVNADILALAAHPFSLCGALKEMRRQNVKPKVIVGLTSASSLETLRGCAAQAEGTYIPTSYAPVTKEAVAAAEATAKFKGSADLHSMAAWENVFIVKRVIESEGVLAKPDSVATDRRKIRDGLAKLKETDGLLGKSLRTPDREAIKPFVFVQANAGHWKVAHTPTAR